MHDPVLRAPRMIWRGGTFEAGARAIPNEVAVAITYDGSTQAVMMATPADLEDFAVGFSFTERLISSVADIQSLEVIEESEGVELRMWLSPGLADTYSRRRRLLAGPTGCGLCGIESLTEAVKSPAFVSGDAAFTPGQIAEAIATLAPAQVLNRESRAMHAAGFWRPNEGLIAVREDVGRHNALDKLAGHLLRTGQPAHSGVVLITSRVSVEMIQKTAEIGATVVVAVSAPTALAVRTADAAGLTLLAVAREGEFEVFTHGSRLKLCPSF